MAFDWRAVGRFLDLLRAAIEGGSRLMLRGNEHLVR
jgi:hypothetical protein